MSEQITIKVSELIGKHICISADDGQKVYSKIDHLLREGNHISVSFEGVTLVISFFLNVAIGQLYGSFDEQTIRDHLRVEGLEPDDRELLKQVVDNAKLYFPNKKAQNAK